ncbi:PREDICTED: LRR receptor-like serine/threonine-protein kinase RCH1 isoform X2 [Tarenaya hassleriana]|uniref:LRR receptor-like serine/threonine-protein kinase RCH1 isoform X2 n=1 Tax=Tarenaya hassleriana TaxID=28532 RepID=UPI00053C2F36|nr:PREDICTED: LRR receptor-like serine/threonine-protein kinase RCH1 isoform X2 [Tarenaya hassleriana]
MMSRNRVSVFLVIILSVSLFPEASGINEEGRALLSWLSAFNSSSSASFFSSWNPSDRNPCRWAYIRCSDDEFVQEIRITSVHIATRFPDEVTSFPYITSIVISDTNLTGEIPVSIGNLSESLVFLDLGFNSLTGQVPPEIGKLKKLESLALNSNFLRGKVPPELGNCAFLQRLELFDNQFSGKIPSEIGKLSSLAIFRAGGNSGLTGEIPYEISNCRKLQYLGLSDTAISGKIPKSLGELKNLETLAVYTANLSGNIPREIGNCSKLENLFLYENQLSGQIPIEIGSLKNLKRLLLWENSLEGRIPGSIGNCTGLKVIDFSVNFLSGDLPFSVVNLVQLEELLLSQNNFSGTIPDIIGNLSSLKQLELDNNGFEGEIPATIGNLKELTLFYAWQDRLTGNIPNEIAYCTKLQSLDLSHNSLTGSIPDSLFSLKNLSQLLLISNQLSGELPANIGSCTSLARLRLSSNRLSGNIPSSIGGLRSLTFLELSENVISGEIPSDIGNCTQLQMLDLHGNKFIGAIPESLQFLTELNVLDLSMNRIGGTLGFCKDLQLLDLSSNRLNGSIPEELGRLQELEILLNLSRNSLAGPIPNSFSSFTKLASLDLSQNKLTGRLIVLSNLINLVSLNVSFNDFSGSIPDTNFFHHLPDDAFLGNSHLCSSENTKRCPSNRTKRNTRNIIVYSLLSAALAITVTAVSLYWLFRLQGSAFGNSNGEEWELTPFQKLGFSINDIVTGLSDSNIVGKGGSCVVYRIETSSRQVIAVKKLLPDYDRENPDWFSAEVSILGTIRHRNIVRLLGYCSKGRTKLLIFDYVSNGSLAELLHEKKVFLDWDVRFGIAFGSAHGLAYLHHDCVPPIIHRDVKAGNILVGPRNEAYLADFGIAKLVDDDDESQSSKPSNVIAGSLGYIAPEYGYSTRITEKSDVYNFGVVILEILTGKQPIDSRIPDNLHIVAWINNVIRDRKGDITSILDEQLMRSSSGAEMEEMKQVLGVALLCVNPNPNDRPSMRDVTAMLAEIREQNQEDDADDDGKVCNNKSVIECSSFSRSSEQPLIKSPV